MDRILRPKLTWTGDGFEERLEIRVGADGMITSVGQADPPVPEQHAELQDAALLPGFVNAHSHAFQIGLRRFPQMFASGASGNFWTWRETMYDLVDRLNPDSCYELSRLAFQHMLRAGITTVAEFHYVHHGDAASWALDEAVIRAARDTGIRLVLLQTYYATGGIGSPLEGARRRFDAVSMDEFLGHTDRLAQMLDTRTQTLGVACHSVRAASAEDMVTLRSEVRRAGWVFHMHLEEQVREIEAFRGVHGKRPLQFVLDTLDPDERFTAVHCTHSCAEDLERLAEAGSNICLCPLTEANLGDGTPDLRTMLQSGAHICLGTDCNLRLSMLEEMRLLEFGQRLVTESTGIAVDESGWCARTLLRIATQGGARSAGIGSGRIAAGEPADFVVLDTRDWPFQDDLPGSLLDDAIFTGENADIASTWIGKPLWTRPARQE